MKYLITGVAGTGKSTLAGELKQRGYPAVDVDAETEIAGSRNTATGEIESVPTPRPEGWRLNHRWMWDGKRLNDYLQTHSDHDIYMCGHADNIEDYFQDFDRVIFLTASPKLIIQRLSSRQPGSFGRQAIEREHALMARTKLEEQAKALGSLMIDTSQPKTEVIAEIVSQAHA